MAVEECVCVGGGPSVCLIRKPGREPPAAPADKRRWLRCNRLPLIEAVISAALTETLGFPRSCLETIGKS